MAHMQTHVDLPTKRQLGRGLEKVKAMDTLARYDKLGFDFDKEAKFSSS